MALVFSDCGTHEKTPPVYGLGTSHRPLGNPTAGTNIALNSYKFIQRRREADASLHACELLTGMTT